MNHTFDTYFAGTRNPSVILRMDYSYDTEALTMTESCDGIETTVSITEEQVSELNSLHASEQIRAASVFAAGI